MLTDPQVITDRLPPGVLLRCEGHEACRAMDQVLDDARLGALLRAALATVEDGLQELVIERYSSATFVYVQQGKNLRQNDATRALATLLAVRAPHETTREE